jgi:hypothetical protein
MFSAGESSGDQHAANMFNELKKLSPGIQGLGMGFNQNAASGGLNFALILQELP